MDKRQFEVILAKVPGSFKSKLERIRRYLLLGKASVMVGAGFSRNADVPSHVRVKLWKDVGEDIFRRLQATDEVDPQELVFKTPMRLASQFVAVNGRNELDNLIRDSIPDDRMEPGFLHRQLLNLPWRDVFTTNYDTLLERSRNSIQRNYSVVTSKEMLLYKPSPRIIKLHGSFPDKTPFLMTEEDFMTYPVKHPEFVNTVRQALVESIFCLVGFSGDDPNFTSWQAWLQDVMGDYAGPSYLITCDNKYDASFGMLMQQRGVDVINFSEIEGVKDYKTAFDFFFTYLSDRESEWKGSVLYNYRTILPNELTEQLRIVRESYPGWFIMPKKYYANFNDMEYKFPYLEKLFDNIGLPERESLLYELDWRADISLSFKDYDWYRANLERVIREYDDRPLSDKAITLGISLLRIYRHHPEKRPEAKDLSEKLYGELYRMSQYQQSRYYYIIACNALSELDYETVDAVLKEWQPTSLNYHGVIYKALVLAESNESLSSIELLSESLDRITLSLSQNTTEEELSLRCAMENLIAFYSLERIPDNNPKYSFFDLLDFSRQTIGETGNEEMEITHGFRVGSLNRTWKMNSGARKSLYYPYRYLLLCESYGFPYGMTTNVVDEKTLISLLPQIANFGMGYSLGVVMRSGSRKLVEAYLKRNVLKMLSRVQADEIAKQMLAATGGKRYVKALEYREHEVLLPFLSRLSSTCSTDVVVQIFMFALSSYKKARRGNKEDLNIIYSNLMPEGTQKVYSVVFDSEIFSDVRENDIPLPQSGLDLYVPSEQAIEIACNGLKSNEKKIKEAAFTRAELLLRTHLSEEYTDRIHLSVRHWRFAEETSLLTRYSYHVVSPTEDEMDSIRELAAADVDALLGRNYTFDKSSTSISAFECAIHKVTLLAQYLSLAQTTTVLEKLSDVLESNFVAYSVDDSDNVFGGFRKYTRSLFLEVNKIVRIFYDNGQIDRLHATRLFDVLQKYLPTGLPVRVTLTRLNIISKSITCNEMRSLIAEHLLSANTAKARDSCNALVAYTHYYANFQNVLQNLIFYCCHTETEQMRLYLQTLSRISIDKMTNATQEQLGGMLHSIMERIPNLDIQEESKVDIMYDGVNLASTLKSVTKPAVLVEAVRQWEEYANDVQVYNDIRRPWFVR